MVANARGILKRIRMSRTFVKLLDNFVRVESGKLNSESKEEVLWLQKGARIWIRCAM
jgi:hypothetical protein